jgi:hypothetical protein
MKMMVDFEHEVENVTIYDFWVSVVLLTLWVIWHVYIVFKVKLRNNKIDKEFGKPWKQVPNKVNEKFLSDEFIDSLPKIF